jgi:hypothetical protein
MGKERIVLLHTAPTLLIYLPPYSTYTHGHTGEETENIPIYLRGPGWEGVIQKKHTYVLYTRLCLLAILQPGAGPGLK